MGADQGGTQRPDEHGTAEKKGSSAEPTALPSAEPTAPRYRTGAGPSPAAFAGAGIELAGLILLGLYAGQWVDKRLGTAPWLLILGVFAGAAAGFFNMLRILTTVERRTKSHDRATRKPPVER